MRILFFGRLAESFGRTVELDAPDGATIATLRTLLALPDPAVRACVGEAIVGDDFAPESEDEVEFWPRVSGG
ncbi:MAG: MoaD/ThiS family protein [Sphingomicrobium sp.]